MNLVETMGTNENVVLRTIVAFDNGKYYNLETLDREDNETMIQFVNRTRERLHDWMDTGRYMAMTVVDGYGLTQDGQLLEKPSSLN